MSAGKAASPDALPRPRALLFDWDSTMVDNWTAIHAAMNITLSRFGQETWSVGQCKTRVKNSLRDAFPRLFFGHAESALRTYLDAYESIHLQHLAEMPAASSMLDAAQERGLYLGIVSNKTGPNLRQEVEHLGWTPRFSRIVGATDAVRDKPAPDPVIWHWEAAASAPVPMSGSSATPTSTCSVPVIAAAPEFCSILRHRRPRSPRPARRIMFRTVPPSPGS
jgi:phosphoglycolate phosphatase